MSIRFKMCSQILMLQSHFCFTLCLQQCTHRSLFLVAISFLLHTLLRAMYTQFSLPCCQLISASHFPYNNVHTVSLSCYGFLSISKTPLLLFFDSRPVLAVVLLLFSMTVHAIANPEAVNLSMHMTAPWIQIMVNHSPVFSMEADCFHSTLNLLR